MSIELPVGIEIKHSGDTLSFRLQIEEVPFNVDNGKHLKASDDLQMMLQYIQRIGNRLGIERVPQKLADEINYSVQDNKLSPAAQDMLGEMVAWARDNHIPVTFVKDVRVLISIHVDYDEKEKQIIVNSKFATFEVDSEDDNLRIINNNSSTALERIRTLLKDMKVDEHKLPRELNEGAQVFEAGNFSSLNSYTRGAFALAQEFAPKPSLKKEDPKFGVSVIVTGAAQLELRAENSSVRLASLKLHSTNQISLSPKQKEALSEILNNILPQSGKPITFDSSYQATVERDAAAAIYISLNSAIKGHKDLKDIKFTSVNISTPREVDIEIKRHNIIEGNCGITVDANSSYINLGHKASVAAIIKDKLPPGATHVEAMGREPHQIIVPAETASDFIKSLAEAIRADSRTKDLKVETSDEKQLQTASLKGGASKGWGEKLADFFNNMGLSKLANMFSLGKNDGHQK